ncbi:MAG: TPM domain-containing protein [Fusobacteriaceae bacterium]|jgi:uncharacterized protein|nr:TPM domain-containing protein [Fusobacteriaceae bacterium]
MRKLKMCKKCLLLALLTLLWTLCLTAALPKVVDEAGLLSSQEEQQLAQMIDKVITKYNKCDVVVVTVNNLGGKSAMAFADDWFDYKGYGVGPDKSGVLFLVSMAEREFWMSTTGYGIKAFTDWGIDQITEKMVPDLSKGNYYRAFSTYVSECDRYLAAAAKGKPVDKDNTFMAGIISLVAGLLGAFGGTAGMKSQLRSIKRQGAAANYVQTDSLNFAAKDAIYLFSNITRTPIPKASSGGGGSSVHTGSSGTSHGGRGGRF